MDADGYRHYNHFMPDINNENIINPAYKKNLLSVRLFFEGATKLICLVKPIGIGHVF